MRNLNRTLRESDDALLPVLAEVWKVGIDDADDTAEIIDRLTDAMLDRGRAEQVWELLDENQRGAFFMLTGFQAKMPQPRFEQIFGDIRRMGEAQINRERPHLNPKSTAEALYYRGLVALGFETTESGARPIVFVPEDLLAVLPTHKTSYNNLTAEGDDAEQLTVEVLDDTEVGDVQQADTSLVDDMTTLLAYLQIHNPLLDIDAEEGALYREFRFTEAHLESLYPHLLNPDEDRLAFLLGVALGGDLVEVQGGKALPKRAEVRRWLERPRAEQVKMLAEMWRDTRLYRDLWHVVGLFPEPGGDLDSYDPTIARSALVALLRELVPPSDWWSIESFIAVTKRKNPDFQRASYDTWYIRNEFDEYLEGFASWDAVEGALLEHLVFEPLHWLGLVDVAEDAARLTAYGRAFVGADPWPQPTEPVVKVKVEADGRLLVSRRVTRLDRFQVARFASWVEAGDPFIYRLDARGVGQAAAQGITAEHIVTFIQRVLGEGVPLPPTIKSVLENWRAGDAGAATLEQMLVLRTNSVETMDSIWNEPTLRRFLGARLGQMAVVVRADQWEALRDALTGRGIQVDIRGE